jgi:hypothetical protein
MREHQRVIHERLNGHIAKFAPIDQAVAERLSTYLRTALERFLRRFMYAALYRHDVAKELRGDNLGDGKPIRVFSTSV